MRDSACRSVSSLLEAEVWQDGCDSGMWKSMSELGVYRGYTDFVYLPMQYDDGGVETGGPFDRGSRPVVVLTGGRTMLVRQFFFFFFDCVRSVSAFPPSRRIVGVTEVGAFCPRIAPLSCDF